MTRINLVPDQHLIAEYHELPRCIKQPINTSDAPANYTLGKGHMKWAKKHTIFLLDRYSLLWDELLWRPTYPPSLLISCAVDNTPERDRNTYLPTEKDLQVSRERLIMHYKDSLRWTNREKPSYMEKSE